LTGNVNISALPGFASTAGANAYTLMTYTGADPTN
jgi:hypothetical protein